MSQNGHRPGRKNLIISTLSQRKDNKKSAAEKRRVYSEVVLGRKRLRTHRLAYIVCSVAGVGHDPTTSGL